MAIARQERAVPPRPLFLYGTLRAMPLLIWALTGDSRKTDVVAPLINPALLKGYARFSARERLPCSDKAQPNNKSQRRTLDHFKGEAYTVTPVQVTVVGEEGQMAEADIYLWNGERDAVSADPWGLNTFIKERRDDWLELFGGMELVGDDEDA
ncbi:hypothetical protein F5146DRAFT_1112930 [Armillaria mellea]|nr:hypothetical protein F5146DRAFT_1112930 [Armillaria mellea]